MDETRKNIFEKWSWAALLLALSIQISGCPPAVFLAGGAVGAGGVAWVKGELEEEFNLPLSRVHQATLAALKEIELPVKEEKKDKLISEITSQFADGKDIWIHIRSLAESSTKIKIRVGIFGDKSRTHTLLETIHRYL